MGTRSADARAEVGAVGERMWFRWLSIGGGRGRTYVQGIRQSGGQAFGEGGGYEG